MNPAVLLDTGPLVALLQRRDHYHRWATEEFDRLVAPILTCEAVVTEACFLVRNLLNGGETVLRLLETGIIRVDFRLSEELASIKRLLARYARVPMSLADACLVRMSEKHPNSVVLTIDSDFIIYRKHGRQVIPLIMPPS